LGENKYNVGNPGVMFKVSCNIDSAHSCYVIDFDQDCPR